MIYKISDRAVWEESQRAGFFHGSPDDLRDGYIHFSTAGQLAGTLAKYHAGRAGLVLAAIDPGRLGPELKWEPARGGDFFPHLHAPLAMADVAWVSLIGLDPDGLHILPEGVI